MYEALTSTSSGGATSLYLATSATAAAITTTGLTSGVLLARIQGVMRINAAGTIIPQLTQVTNDAAASVAANSYFRIWPAGPNTVTNAGNWS